MSTLDRPKLFISHASEDKDSFVRPLAKILQKSGMRIWYDEFSLNVGDSLRASIDRGLLICDYGVVVLSHAFFSKKWTQDELEGLFAKEALRKVNLILPIWHGIKRSDVFRFSPILAGRKAILSSESLKEISAQIKQTVSKWDKTRNVKETYIESPLGGAISLFSVPNPPASIQFLDEEKMEKLHEHMKRQATNWLKRSKKIVKRLRARK